VTNDATFRWREDRPQLAFGEIGLQQFAPNDAGEQQHTIFDPIPRVHRSLGRSALRTGANIYLMSGRRRRAAAAP